MIKISAVIITLNEEKNIGRCLDAIKEVADEVIVIDSFSTDRTKAICAEYGVNFIEHNWEGHSSSKNFGNKLAKNDWILSVDADEVISEQLKMAISDINPENPAIAYKMNRLSCYCGKWIKHGGWYPDTKLRLWNRNFGKWEGDIHEQVVVQPGLPISFLNGDILHYTYNSFKEHVEISYKYSELAAKSLLSKGKKVGWHKLIISPVLRFIKSYFLKKGILDGKIGLMIAITAAYSTFLKYFLTKYYQKSNNF